MEAIKKQATKLREQVARQQQAVLKHLGHFSHEDVAIDESELRCHQQLQDLYGSTRAAKHLQRNIVRGIEGFIATSSKLMEIVRKLGNDCCIYGTEYQNSGSPLARAALCLGTSLKSLEDERKTLLGVLGDQVSQPLRTFITGPQLEDARQLAYQYDRLRHETEAQAADILRRRSKTKESEISPESYTKLKSSEARLTDLKSSMAALGKEATSAMLSVQDQQQTITLQRLLALVDAEKSYHRRALDILEKLHAEMIMEEQSNESSSEPTTVEREINVHPTREETYSNRSDFPPESYKQTYFIAKVVHPFNAQADGELSLVIDDYVVVRQVGSSGWSEGECKGKAGWFPSAYVEKQEKAPARKLIEANSSR